MKNVLELLKEADRMNGTYRTSYIAEKCFNGNKKEAEKTLSEMAVNGLVRKVKHQHGQRYIFAWAITEAGKVEEEAPAHVDSAPEQKPAIIEAPAKLTINKGDNVKISAHGMTLEGTVISANDYSDWNNAGWYIEFMSVTNGYCYWKQRDDGGKIISVNGQEVTPPVKPVTPTITPEPQTPIAATIEEAEIVEGADILAAYLKQVKRQRNKRQKQFLKLLISNDSE
jgi:hypothetical protein